MNALLVLCTDLIVSVLAVQSKYANLREEYLGPGPLDDWRNSWDSTPEASSPPDEFESMMQEIDTHLGHEGLGVGGNGMGSSFGDMADLGGPALAGSVPQGNAPDADVSRTAAAAPPAAPSTDTAVTVDAKGEIQRLKNDLAAVQNKSKEVSAQLSQLSKPDVKSAKELDLENDAIVIAERKQAQRTDEMAEKLQSWLQTSHQMLAESAQHIVILQQSLSEAAVALVSLIFVLTVYVVAKSPGPAK